MVYLSKDTSESVSYIGHCVVLSGVRVNGELHGHVAPGDVAVLLERYR